MSAITPDSGNRKIVEDEDFQSLLDSIRVLGVLQPIHVRAQEDGAYLLVDGERRWRAAKKAGLTEIPCDIWPDDVEAKRIQLAAFALNEQRKAPGCIHIARRLRDIKNEHGLSLEVLAAETGLPLNRVKTYFSLFGASDYLLTFCDQHDLVLKVAAELCRYERATNEARARRLAERYLEAPMSAQEISAMRKRHEEAKATKESKAAPKSDASGLARLFGRLEVAYLQAPHAAQPLLERWLRGLGFELAPIPQPILPSEDTGRVVTPSGEGRP